MSWSNSLTAGDIGAFHADAYSLKPVPFKAYVMLVMRMRRHGPIPFDDHILAPIAGCGSKVWTATVWPTLAPLFVVEDGLLRHPAIMVAPPVKQAPRADRSVQARNAANARWAQATRAAAEPELPALPRWPQ